MKLRKRIILSVITALFTLVFSYWVTNLNIPISGEKEVIATYEYLTNSEHPLNVPDSILLINVSYDRELVDVTENEIPIGNTPITDRKKLLKLLKGLEQDTTYKYVLLDIFFSERYNTDADSALFSTINSLPRIVVPCHQNSTISSEINKNKLGIADYLTTPLSTDFVKYQYTSSDGISLAQKMYEDMTKHKIDDHTLFYFDNGHLARNSVVLTYELLFNQTIHDYNSSIWQNLGTDVLDEESDELNIDYKDKYILIGAFDDDIHSTYMGAVSGPIINFNAYLALLHGKHYVSLWFFFIMFILFFIMSFLVYSEKTLKDYLAQFPQFAWKPLQIVMRIILLFCSWMGFASILTFMCIVTYLQLGEIYDIVITATFFELLRKSISIINATRLCKE